LSRAQFDEWREQVADSLQQAEELRLQEAEKLALEQTRNAQTTAEVDADMEWEL
jgi:hypothetical protein